MPYYDSKDLESKQTSDNIRHDIQAIIDSGNVNAISFASYLYPFIKESNFTLNGENIDLLTWNEGANWVLNMITDMFADSQVKVILAGERGEWR